MHFADFFLRVVWFGLGYAFLAMNCNPFPRFTWEHFGWYMAQFLKGTFFGTIITGLVWIMTIIFF